MKKTTSKIKRQCKLCSEPVTNKTGLQCRGACQRWMHFKCLNFTPGKIQDVKKGIIQVNCPCPNCNTTVPREVLVDVPLICEDKSCPATKPPICDQPQCPSHFKSQDIKAPPPPLTPKPITTIRGCDIAPPCGQSLPDLPPEPPMEETCDGQKSPPANTPCKPKPDSKCKPIAKEKPKTEPVKYKCQAAKPNCTEEERKEAAPCDHQSLPDLPPEPPMKEICHGQKSPPANIPCKPKPDSKCKPVEKEKPKTDPVKYKCQAAKPNCTEDAASCRQSLPDLPPGSPPVKEIYGGEKRPVINNKKPSPPSTPCMYPVCPSDTENEQPALLSPLRKNPYCDNRPAPATPPPLPKTPACYPNCCQSAGGQKGCSCGGNLKKTMSDCKITSEDEHILINALENLCAVMGELSKQVKNLVGKLVNMVETG